MVIADFFIICFQQKHSEIDPNLEYNVVAYKRPATKKVLSNEQLFAQDILGIWYSFEPKERENGDYSAEWFDLDDFGRGKRVVLIPEHSDKVLRVFDRYVNSLSCEYIGVMFRLEGKNHEKIFGVLSKQKFRKMLLDKKIKYNCLYILK